MQGLTEAIRTDKGVRYAPLRHRPSIAAHPAESKCRLGFLLFLLVNVNLFLRPTDLIPALDGYPIYEISICLCLLASASVVVQQLSWAALKAAPISLMVVLIVPATFMASMSHGDQWFARHNAIDIFKVVLYYLLLVGLVTTPKRLRFFVLFIFVCLTLMAILVLLQYYGVIGNRKLAAVTEAFTTDSAGNRVFVDRVQGFGIFEDPNDLSLVMVTAVMIGIHFVIRAQIAERMICITPIGLILFTFVMTHSRGGFLSMLAAVITMATARLGWKKGILFLVLATPLALPFLDARQTDLDLGDRGDTAQGRIHLWRDAMVLFHHSPIFGIGVDKLVDEIGIVAHNSFVQGYAEMGLFGGTAFFAVYYLSITRLMWIRKRLTIAADPELAPWARTLLAVCIGYAVGICSLTRNYVISTYVAPGLVCAYSGIVSRRYPWMRMQFNGRMLRNVVLASLGMILVLEIIARFFAY
ncbi:MAG TPA: O-antigen ligase family protein [Tepidisphaeraceae bacterium]|nr:O-antigen ligase family protein [Tepidisphaeraceae bacterium]